MSITLNRFPVLSTSLYSEEMFGRPAGSVAGFISGFRHTVLGSPALIACIVVNVVVLSYVFSFLATKNPVPLVGYPRWLGAYYGAARFAINSARMVEEGYKKYKGGFFRLPLWNNWAYIVANEKCIDEMYHLPDDVLSLRYAAHDELQLPYTMGKQLHDDPYHLSILRTRLTRHIDYLVRECLDELPMAFEDTIGKKCGDTWTELNAFDSFIDIVARTFNRILVGAPTCRSAKYTATCKEFAFETSIVGFIINLFPTFLQPIVGRAITRLPSLTRRSLASLGPVIAERQAAMAEYGPEWQDKPMDLLMWLMEAAQGREREPERLAIRILVINIATIHTTATTFVHGLNNLLDHMEYVAPLREEADEAIYTQGWTKQMVNQLVKTDSFFKESSRLNGLGTMSFPRKALRDITFSDGTTVPEGSYISSAFYVHVDEEFYPDPFTFDAFRFLQESSGGSSNNSSNMIRTNPRYLIFGHGKYPCPGRFLATYILKATMAHLMTNYEIKHSPQGRLPDILFQYNRSPNIHSAFMIRRRKVA
ncbi:cytochrome P450 [Laetiporus sulphureus 93-53]|uniref:Cytochrome P450 n=1 Tax=Laetiporus sulphureus 93-53 TaxID=1314785 RepID=A0A165BZ10_9APHY|nr:cytochrome P450 [Laetiporus sulphureus 93-53]KZT01907.1 cytochrome P450 [Laetiporus sulphureus 93-53]